jgi:aminoglycoside 3-N-acetyltransferase
MCHSFLPSLGQLVPGPEIVVETLLAALGPDGTFVVPAFSYSFFRGDVFVVEESPSKVGVLGDVVRKFPGAVRSPDPLFSMAAVGRDAADLMRRESTQCFGPGSIYGKLLDTGRLHVLLLGVDFTALSLFMHLEKINGVKYRYNKSFPGTTSVGGRTFPDEAVHFVRDRVMKPVTHRPRIGALIDQQPECLRRKFAYGEHRRVPAATIARLVREQLARDPFYLIKDPIDLTKAEMHG